MRIIFLRHAEAEPDGPDGTDAGRRLTRKGKTQARRSARAMRRLKQRPSLVATSPLRRAVQTAEIAAAEFKPAEIETLPALGVPFGRAKLSARLKQWLASGAECVCLVGHAPTLGDYAGWLIGTTVGEAVDLGKAGAACVDLTAAPAAGTGRLIWLMTRKQLAMLA